MSTNQTDLLLKLVKKLKSEKKDFDSALLSLQRAKILTKNGNFSKQYSNLNRIISNAK